MSKNILIIGATSAIAQACARIWAKEGASLFLVGRQNERLDQMAADLSVRGAAVVHSYPLDLNQFDQHSVMIDTCFSFFDTLDIALIAHGTLPDQKACEQDMHAMFDAFATNGLSTLSLLTPLANRMQARGAGTIAVIASVAGDRGRPSNYVYGSAKAAVITFCAGLRARMGKYGVHVLTIKPGFIDTPMTVSFKKGALWATPERVANDIDRAIRRKTNTLYTPWFWRWIMLIIQHIPECIFKRLSL